MKKEKYPTIKIGDLIEKLQIYPKEFDLDFCGLEFYRLKKRGGKSVQLEFNQPVYIDKKGNVVIQNLDNKA